MTSREIRLIEERLERIEHVGNLQLQELQRLYNGTPVVREDYRAGKFILHVHGIWHEGADSAWRVCLQMRSGMHPDICSAAGAQLDWNAMPISTSQIVKPSEPCISIVRLKTLDQCDFFRTESFEFGRHPAAEFFWSVTNRKLQTLIEGPTTSFDQSADQIVQGDDQMLEAFAHNRREFIETCRNRIVEVIRSGRLPPNKDFRSRSAAESIYRFFEVRQAFVTLADPPASIVD